MHSSITEVSADFRSDHSDIPSGVTRRGFVTAAATLFAFPRIAEGQEPSQALTPGELKSVIELVNANYARSINFAGPYQERTSQFDEGLLEISRYIDWIRDEAKRNGAAGICNIADSDFSSRRESMRQNLWDALLLCDFPGTSGRYESGKLNRFFFQTLPEVCAQFGIVPLVGAVPIGDKESGKIVHFDPMMSFLIIDRTEWAVVADLSFKDTPVRAIITKGSVGSQGTSFADSFAAFTLYDTIFIDQDSLVNLENLATLPLSSLHPPELIELERQAGPDVAPINIALRFVSIVDDSEKYQASIQGALYLIDRALRASPISPADTLQTQVAHESAHLFVAREGAHRPYTTFNPNVATTTEWQENEYNRVSHGELDGYIGQLRNGHKGLTLRVLLSHLVSSSSVGHWFAANRIVSALRETLEANAENLRIPLGSFEKDDIPRDCELNLRTAELLATPEVIDQVLDGYANYNLRHAGENYGPLVRDLYQKFSVSNAEDLNLSDPTPERPALDPHAERGSGLLTYFGLGAVAAAGGLAFLLRRRSRVPSR